MTVTSSRNRSFHGTNALLILTSLLFSFVVAEAAVRIIDDQPLFAFPLPEPVGTDYVKPESLKAVPLAAGVDAAWFAESPAPLPNRADPPPGWQNLFNSFQDDYPSGRNGYQPNDLFKVWNTVFAPNPCTSSFLRNAPGRIYVYDPPDGWPSPPYRFYPGVTSPDHLVTNQIGWRGAPIEVPRGPRTVRIVFAGSSTVIDGHWSPYSYPEFVGHWLNRWAASKKLDVHFEVLNSARESNVSTDIANVVRTEVLPLHPDLVVYYEGGNQFDMEPLGAPPPFGPSSRPPSSSAGVSPSWLRAAARFSELLRRVQAAIGFASSDLSGREWTKPDYRFVWPQGIDEQDPAISDPRLPVNLETIGRDLDRIRADLATVGSEFALSSFAWLARDGMVLDPVRHRYIIEQLNEGRLRFRYRDVERVAAFQNRWFAKYARVHGLPFIDVAGQLPFDPDLFIDAVHTSYAGTRLRGWITLQALVPVIEKHLADKTWPRPPEPAQPLPTFAPREVTFKCARQS